MNTTLPAPRDLPPHRHARIRAEVERAVARRSPWVWLTPALTGAVVVALIAVVGWPAGPPTTQNSVPATQTPPLPPGRRPVPVLPAIPSAMRTMTESTCGNTDRISDAVLYQEAADRAGWTYLLYGPSDSRLGGVVECSKDEAFVARDTLVGPLDWLPGPMSLDVNWNYLPDGTGRHGLEVVAGRVTSHVARVTFTEDGVTRNTAVVNRTFLLRVVHSSDQASWQGNQPFDGVVRAYDKYGRLLATIAASANGDRYDAPCYRVPGGMLLPKGAKADKGACQGAVPWR